jgi:hypothetical protein
MEYLQNKRPDLMPRPGFMRQLQALDASLQRVLKAGSRSPSDPSLKRYSEWDVGALCECAYDPVPASHRSIRCCVTARQPRRPRGLPRWHPPPTPAAFDPATTASSCPSLVYALRHAALPPPLPSRPPAATAVASGGDPGAEEELLLVNTYLNSQSAPEEVIRAAQSDTPVARESSPARHRL